MRHMDAGGEFAEVPDTGDIAAAPTLTIPDNLRWLWRLERQERHAAHEVARHRFELLAGEFGQGENFQAYFAVPIESGKRRVLLSASDNGYHVILNDETVAMSAASELYYAEWALDPDKCLTGFRESTARRPDHSQGWASVVEAEAFLFAYNGSLRVIRGSGNELVVPPQRWYPIDTETFVIRDRLNALNVVFSGLTAAMHEPVNEVEIG